ncbi:predicted protein [Nematostella vectensis]|uniref:Sestrin n=1 Tax=Nematostella vectensis TaxID=45351 RepID=A7SCG7_NEMVE|nr:sestrin-1 [Nematostella vectensis]EDO38575.1 predicted protein [Nematostella vectensis]|eukprot:XP_001630638.1 predicted protein [Nematostella vectensis]
MSDDEDFIYEEDSLRDFSILRTRDANVRGQFLDSLVKAYKTWANRRDETINNGRQNLFVELLPCILSLSIRCPFPDVREKCSKVLENVKSSTMPVPRPLFKGPSSFIPSKELPSMDTDDEQTHSLLVDSFLFNGRVPNVTCIIGVHPQYLDWNARTEYFLMRGEGPLPYDWRHYIAIMAASRHQCSYLVSIYEREFLRYHGDKQWLKGIQHIPKKLHALLDMNKYLAHQPWLVSTQLIEKLLKGEDNWSLSELVHAIVIMAHIHALSSFVYGCGVVPEIDSENGHTFKPPTLTETNQASFDSGNATTGSESVRSSTMTRDELMARMREVRAEQDTLMEASQEELFQHFEKLESGELAHFKDEAASTPTESLTTDLARYLEDPNFRYQDFASRPQQDISTFRIQDCSWEEHGFSLFNRLYPDIGTLLDEKFSSTLGLTYFTLGDRTNVDTTVFRMATWNYIHLIFGIYHDDYLYTEVNKLMERSYKRYIKKVACVPEKATQEDYLEFMPELTHSEKVHINLLLLEARLQAELLYATRAIMKYMT